MKSILQEIFGSSIQYKKSLKLKLFIFFLFASACVPNKSLQFQLAQKNNLYQKRLDSLNAIQEEKISRLAFYNEDLEKQIKVLAEKNAPSGSLSSNNEKVIEQLRSELEAAKKINVQPAPSPIVAAKPKVVKEIIYRNSTKVIVPESLPGKVSFFCPDEMREENTYEVSAMLGYLLDDAQIKNELLQAVNEVRLERGEKELGINDMVAKDITMGRYMKIQLIDPGNKFNIVVPENYPKSEDIVSIFNVDSNAFYNKTFTWKWLVTPKANSSGKASLKIIVTPYNKDMKPQAGKERDFLIQVKFKQSFFGSVWEKAHRNPEWAIASIITPLLTFFAGKILGKKKGEESK